MPTGEPEIVEIAIRVRSIGQLFNSFDPSPFRDRDLDEDAEEFIVGWIRELAPDAPFAIVITLPKEEAEKCAQDDVRLAFAHYFEDRALHFEREQRELFRIGRYSLAIGITVLTLCLTASQIVSAWFPNPPFSRIIEESLILVGWVANWRPIEVYLYDWWPIRRRRRLYRRIAAAPVMIRAQ
jgi:hypothetical protein